MSDIIRIIDKDLEEINVNNGSLDINITNVTVDPYTKSLKTIDTQHNEIHEGENFFRDGYVAMGSTATTNYVITVGAKALHTTFEITSADAGFSYTTYEEITADADGTLLPMINNNRLSTNIATATLRLNPGNVVTTSATLLRNGINGTGTSPSNRTSGSVSRTNEVILKPDTKYLIRIINLSSSTNNVTLNLEWYEV